jgi:hypothetical protein
MRSSAFSAGARSRLSATDAKGQVSDAPHISAYVFDSERKDLAEGGGIA